MRIRWTALALAVLFLLNCFSPAVAIAQSPSIQHIVFIVQENHSFDNYFGTYPASQSPWLETSFHRELPGPTNLTQTHPPRTSRTI